MYFSVPLHFNFTRHFFNFGFTFLSCTSGGKRFYMDNVHWSTTTGVLGTGNVAQTIMLLHPPLNIRGVATIKCLVSTKQDIHTMTICFHKSSVAECCH